MTNSRRKPNNEHRQLELQTAIEFGRVLRTRHGVLHFKLLYWYFTTNFRRSKYKRYSLDDTSWKITDIGTMTKLKLWFSGKTTRFVKGIQ